MLEGIRPGWVVVICTSFIGLAGCESNQPTHKKVAVQPFRGQEIDLVAPSSLDLPAQWESMVQEWSAQSGATAQFKPYDQSADEFDSSAWAKSGRASVVFWPLNRICEVDRQFTPLSITDGQFDARDLLKGLRERVLSRDKQIVISPISVPVLVCYYRSDLLRAANREAPETWEDYHKLVESLDSWAPGLSAVEPLSPRFRATTFFARSLAFAKHPENYSVWFDIDSGLPTLNTPGFEKALTTARETWRILAPESRNLDPSECRNRVLSGKAALALSFETSEAELKAANATSEKDSTRVDGIKVGFCRLPGVRTVYNRNSKKWDTLPAKAVHAPALCGFAGLAAGVVIPSRQTETSAAMNLLATLCSASEFDRAFAALPKNVCRESQLIQASGWYAQDLSAEEGSLYCDAVAQSLRDTQLVFDLPLIGADEFRQAAASVLEPLLKGEADVAQTLDSMQQKFEAIVQNLGADAVRDSYRRGLGMSPMAKKQ